MRKFLSVMLPIFIMLAVSGICIGIYIIFTNELPKSENNLQSSEITENSQKSDDNTVILLQNELPRIGSSEITYGLVTELIKNFTQNDDGQELNIKSEITEDGFNSLLNDDIDVLISTYPSEDVLQLASTKGIELDIIPIAADGFVFFVSSTNPIDGLKVSDIQKIYNGQVNNWAQIGGENQVIKAFQRPNNSPSQSEMIISVMKNLQMIDSPKDIFYDKNFGEIKDIVATYDNSPNAIGYSYLYETKLLYDIDAKSDNAVKILKINDVAPNYNTIKNGTYPIKANYYLIKNKANTSESLGIFTDAVLSERGKKVIKEAGYVDN